MEEKITHLLDELSLLEAIERCGELKISVEEVAVLLAGRPCDARNRSLERIQP
jgi:hypothetical protein